jgi:hypothetical protein
MLSAMPYVFAQAVVAVYVRYNVARDLAGLPQAAAMQAQSLQRMWASPFYKQSLDHLDDQQRAQTLAMHQQLFASLQQQSRGPPPQVQHGYLPAIAEAIVRPVATTSWGSIAAPGGPVAPYIAPNALYDVASVYGAGGSVFVPMTAPPGAGTAWQDALENLVPVLGCLAFATAVLAIFPFSLAVLPISRRRAKVRWSHIARVAAYSVVIPTITILMCAALALGHVLTSQPAWAWWAATVALAGPPALTVAWWWAAIGRYLKMPHAFAIAALLTLTCALVVFALLFYILIYP